MPAKGSAEWKGDVPTGTGTFTAGDTISGGYTFKSRFEDGPGSNPEQLIAAAHAACFSMALSNILAQAGTPPESVHTDATVTLRPVDGSPHHHQNRPGHGGHGARDRRGRLQGARRGGQGRLPGEPRPGRRARDHPRGVAGLNPDRGPSAPSLRRGGSVEGSQKSARPGPQATRRVGRGVGSPGQLFEERRRLVDATQAGERVGQRDAVGQRLSRYVRPAGGSPSADPPCRPVAGNSGRGWPACGPEWPAARPAPDRPSSSSTSTPVTTAGGVRHRQHDPGDGRRRTHQ